MLFGLLGVVLLALISGAYVLGRNQQAQIRSTISPTLSQQKVADSTAEWKTYINTKYQYTIGYPDFLKHTSEIANGVTTEKWAPSDNSYAIFVISYPDGVNSYLQFYADIKKDESISIVGQKVRKLVGTEVVSEKGTLIHIGPIKRSGQNHMLVYSSTSDLADSRGISVFDQMILTFKFIDQKQSVTVSQPVIPPDWKQFTDEDWGFGVKATMSLPPGFSFKFSGSEFLIQKDSDASEIWAYLTSISNDENGKSTNFYNGESRRVWYQEYLKGKHGGAVRNSDIAIVSTKEHAGYLEVIVSGISSNNESHYLFVKNGIMNIIQPSSAVAYGSDAVIKKNIAAIISSVSVAKTK